MVHSTGIRPKGITTAHLTVSNIGEDYWEADFNNYGGPQDAAKLVWDYLGNLRHHNSRGTGFLLAGKVGVGKTTLMAIALKYLVKSNWSCYMTSLSELVEEIKRSWDDKSLTSNIDYYKHVHFLGLDDLGKEHQGPTGFSAVTFDNLLRYRVQHRHPTFFTTNLDRREIKSRYGDATLSLIEGKTKVIPMNGDDYRREIQKRALRQPE